MCCWASRLKVWLAKRCFDAESQGFVEALPLGLFTWCPGCWVLLSALDIQCCKMKLLNWVSHFCLTLTQKPRDSWSLTKGSQRCRFLVVGNMSIADSNASFERVIDLTVYLVTWHDRHLIHIVVDTFFWEIVVLSSFMSFAIVQAYPNCSWLRAVWLQLIKWVTSGVLLLGWKENLQPHRPFLE